MLLTARWASVDAPPLPPGKHTIVFDFKYDGPGIAKGGTGVLKVDGKEVAHTARSRRRSPSSCRRTRPSTSGSILRTAVNDLDYQVPFRFNGKINKLTFKVGPSQLSVPDQKSVMKAAAKAKD